LKTLVEDRLPHEALVQLLYLHTARAQRVFADFILDVYWPKYSAGAQSINREDAERFILRALDSGRMATRWSASTVKRVSGYILGCCADFGLVANDGRTSRCIQRFSIRPEVSLYLTHDLHCAGLGDMAVVRNADWRLFGLEFQEVLGQIKSLAANGHLWVQSSGELIQVSWKYRTMEDCLNALTQRQV
jgi:hypothetical protein